MADHAGRNTDACEGKRALMPKAVRLFFRSHGVFPGGRNIDPPNVFRTVFQQIQYPVLHDRAGFCLTPFPAVFIRQRPGFYCSIQMIIWIKLLLNAALHPAASFPLYLPGNAECRLRNIAHPCEKIKVYFQIHSPVSDGYCIGDCCSDSSLQAA